MKRNLNGINLDQGVPLVTEKEFRQFYVPGPDPVLEKITYWLRAGTGSLLFGGQIGSGKSTVIQKALMDCQCKPDIMFHFDREGTNLSVGDFWRITLAGVLQNALNTQVDLSAYQLPAELSELNRNDWQGLVDQLVPSTLTIDSYRKKIAISERLTELDDYIHEILTKIAQNIEAKMNRPLFLFASGVDKYHSSTSGFFSLKSILNFLAQYRTLFEVNAIHLFEQQGKWTEADKTILTTMPNQTVVAMLEKRMGIYQKVVSDEMPIIAEWSGGNPRQAIRILTHFEALQKRKDKAKAELVRAIEATYRDFFSFSSLPARELIDNVAHEKRLRTSLVNLPGDKETAQMALYGNWILITDQMVNGFWPVIVNPIIKNFFRDDLMPLAPEAQLLKKYAEQKNTSYWGLSTPAFKKETRENDYWLNFLKSELENPMPLNIVEILEVMASALLSKDRNDRVIIAYRDEQVLAAARHYLFARANSFEYQLCKHYEWRGGEKEQPREQLLNILSESADIISLQFLGEWTTDQLIDLEKSRDLFIDYQMIWWIPVAILKRYLSQWTQLRQIFQVFVLEDQLLSSLDMNDIESDLNFFKDLDEGNGTAGNNFLHYMKSVLEWLQGVKRGTHVE